MKIPKGGGYNFKSFSGSIHKKEEIGCGSFPDCPSFKDKKNKECKNCPFG